MNEPTVEWTRTNELRFMYYAARGHILQQKWVSADGREKWEDVPVVNKYLSDKAMSEEKEENTRG